MNFLKKKQEIIEFILISFIIAIIYGINSHTFGLLIPSFLMIFFMGLNILRFLKKEKFKNLIGKAIKARYLIYLFLFIVGVLCKLNGSSIGCYDQFLTEKKEETITNIYGIDRYMRSDEYVVLTPYYMNQTYNHFEKYNEYMSLEGQNMIVSYNAPVKDITTLAKPLNWGYMLLGKEYGLAWYWCMKQILLFAFSFEVSYILTKKNQILSILGACLIAFGPSTLWWFAPHMPDVLLWSMGVLCGGYYFFQTKKEWLKNLLTILLPLLISEFVIAIFPSFQVGLGIFIFLMLILFLVRDKSKLFQDKKQIIRLGIVFILTLFLVGYFVYTNIDELLISLNTVYPGKRVVTGGDGSIIDLFTDLTTIFLPYRETIPYSNFSEVSTYLHFGMFFVLLSPVLIKELKKKKDRNYIEGIGFVSIILVYAFFMIIGFPEFLAKLTLFSYINRMKMILGIILVFFTIWSVYVFLKQKIKINPIYYFSCVGIYSLTYLLTISKDQLSFLPLIVYIIEIISFAAILIGLYIGYQKTALSLILGLLIMASLPINPIKIGISSIENHPSAIKLKEIRKEDKDSYWIVNEGMEMQGYLLANGIKTINAVNYYPDFKKWYTIDNKKEYEDYYNRYAHIIMTITEEEEPIFEEVPTPDVVKVQVPLDKLEELKVKYIFSLKELTKETNNFKLEEIYKDKDCHIYEVRKKESES